MTLTEPALREAVYAALTAPPLTYMTDLGGSYGTATLPSENVKPRSVWIQNDNPPSPLVSFAIAALPRQNHFTDGDYRLRVWVSGNAELTVVFVYAAIVARLHTADQQGPAPSISRPQTSAQLGVVVRSCLDDGSLPPDFDKDSGRWYKSGSFRVVAI